MPSATPAEQVSTLRGAPVAINPRRAAQVLVIVALLGLATASVVLFLAALHTDDQHARLRRDGVPVELTVTGCGELIGGTGTNGGGYSCNGTFLLDGRRYRETIPGDRWRAAGSTVRAVSVPGDPALLVTVDQLSSDRGSATLFVAAAAATLAFFALLGLLARRRRRRGGAAAAPSHLEPPIPRGGTLAG